MLLLKIVTNEGEDLKKIRSLFLEYANELNENLDFQRFKEELAQPLKKYGKPLGSIILAYFNGNAAGCVAFTEFPNSDKKICEMKRLYVKPIYRKNKIGEALIEEILKSARIFGFEKMRLDSLKRLQSATNLYKKFGFVTTEAYYLNPLLDAIYMEKNLI